MRHSISLTFSNLIYFAVLHRFPSPLPRRLHFPIRRHYRLWCAMASAHHSQLALPPATFYASFLLRQTSRGNFILPPRHPALTKYLSSTDAFIFPLGHTPSPYDAWGEQASKLENENFRAEYVYLSSKLRFCPRHFVLRGFTTFSCDYRGLVLGHA